MTSEVATDAPGFWYDKQAQFTGTDVLNALRRYRSAEIDAQRRARDALGIGENALLAIRFLLRAEQAGRTVNGKDLAEHLHVTAASTSALVDRLVRSGHVVRHADPDDRRGVVLTATGTSMRYALAVIEELDTRTLDTAEQLPDDAMAVVIEFLDDMTRVVGGIDTSRDAAAVDFGGAQF